jgi:hypothetical protein
MTGGVVAVSTNPAIDRIALAPAAAGGGLVRATCWRCTSRPRR